MKHQAIYNLYPMVKTISEDLVARDINGEIVEWDKSLVDEEVAKLKIPQMKSEYKGYYLGMFNTKLKELDYDSIATVNSWIGDETFGAEATIIITWYKNIIKTNHSIAGSIANSLKYNDTWVDIIPTKEEYLAELPVFGA